MLPSVEVRCPYCAALFELPVDATAEELRFSHPCPACARPMRVVVDIDEDGVATATVESEAEG